MRHVAHWLALGLAAFSGESVCGAPHGGKGPWPHLDWPAALRPEVIADDMRMNGRPVRLLQIRSAQDMDTVERQVREALGPKARSTRVGPRRIVSAPIDGTFVTADLRPARRGGVHAYVMQSRAPAAGMPSAPALPVPADSVLRSVTESNDSTVNGTVSLIENRHGVEANADFFRRRYLDRGWRVLSSRELSSGPQRGRVDEYQGRIGRAVVVVEDRGEVRSVVVNEVMPKEGSGS